MCRQEPRDRLDLDCMHTGIDKAWSTQRDSMQCLQHGAQCSQRMGGIVCSEHWAGWPGKQLYGAVGTLYCSIYAAHWTDLRSALAQAVKHNQPAEMLQAGSKAISHKVAMSAVPVVLHLWSLLSDSGIRMTVEESVCLSGAGRQHSNPHARRRLDACGAGLSVET
jgi:hypothetical protein